MMTQLEIKLIHADRLSKAGGFFFAGLVVMVITWWITEEMWTYPILLVCLGLQLLFHGTAMVMWAQIRREAEEKGREENKRDRRS